MLHRDIKPGNVIVGKHSETLVVDWGLAKATGESAPPAGERSGLPIAAGPDSDRSADDRRNEADLAIWFLRRARAAGVPVSKLMDVDPDLAPLHTSPDFPMVQLDLGFPADAFARGNAARPSPLRFSSGETAP